MRRRHLRFSTLQEAVADAKLLQANGYDRIGNWSLGQNVEHLNKTLRMATVGEPFMVPAIIRPLLKLIVFRKMKKGDMLKFRAKAPPAVQPAEDVDAKIAIAEFEALSTAVEAEDAELAATHPVFGTFSAQEWRIMQRWHASHHLGFLVPKAAQ